VGLLVSEEERGDVAPDHACVLPHPLLGEHGGGGLLRRAHLVEPLHLRLALHAVLQEHLSCQTLTSMSTLQTQFSCWESDFQIF
jgi:hypothetical protein